MNPFRTMLQRASQAGLLMLVVFLAAANARADDPAVLGDLDALSPEKLSKAQLEQLLPNAKMTRIAVTGSNNAWTNELDGTLVASTNNKAGLGGGSMVSIRTYTAPGKWHISDDGRYCVNIQWKGIKDEEWCRFVFKTSQGYFASNSDQNKAAKVYKLGINGN
jgi:hypothetical protein